MTREDAEKIIDEQVEENRGLRRDVCLMQEANAEQRALIEQQAGVIQRQWDYIEQLKQTISGHEQAGMEGLIRDYNDHQRIEQQAREIARLKEALEVVAGEASFLSEAEAVAKQALKEEHP